MVDNLSNKKFAEWLKVRYSSPSQFDHTISILSELKLNTICQEGLCPNRAECFSHGVATFMILGNKCTRNCHYCHVAPGKPVTIDKTEPERVAKAVQQLGLSYVVITSVNRDDLPDGGACMFVETVDKIRELNPKCAVELLIPDFKGNFESLRSIVQIQPEVLSHNIETVEEIFSKVRPQGNYLLSLQLIGKIKQVNLLQKTKSSLMLGLGEEEIQIEKTLRDLIHRGCDFLTLGQYLQPTEMHWPVKKYYTPNQFEKWRLIALGLGFKHVESGPLVRSSYRADKLQFHLTQKINPNIQNNSTLPIFDNTLITIT